mmetsp:Transcript_9508/g.27118  ORF Transcript_9508/g.27118 Transcript_9508/m.27118 type:complete len:218 (+) Transcript_9508:295-948(+)
MALQVHAVDVIVILVVGRHPKQPRIKLEVVFVAATTATTTKRSNVTAFVVVANRILVLHIALRLLQPARDRTVLVVLSLPVPLPLLLLPPLLVDVQLVLVVLLLPLRHAHGPTLQHPAVHRLDAHRGVHRVHEHAEPVPLALAGLPLLDHLRRAHHDPTLPRLLQDEAVQLVVVHVVRQVPDEHLARVDVALRADAAGGLDPLCVQLGQSAVPAESR